jgi:outer membrane protein TolC
MALALAGCVRFQPQPLSPENLAATFEQRSLICEEFRLYAETNLHRAYPTWPPPAWDLETLTLGALYYNPDLAVARAYYDSVSAGKTTAAQHPNPSLNVSPAYNSTTAVPSPWLVTATLDVPIETAGKRGHRIAHAGHLSDAAGFALTTAAWDVRVRLRRALLEVWMAQESEALLRQQLAAQESIVGLLEKELTAGGIAPAEVTRERIALEQTRLALLEAQNRLAQARPHLASVIGVPSAALDARRFSFDFFSQPPAELPPAEARRRALLNRADILGALANYAASESALQLEIAKQYPDVHLSPGYEFDQGDSKWGVGLNVELPVLNRNRGPIAEAEARRRESAAKFDALQSRVFGEIEVALAGSQNAQKTYAAAQALWDHSQAQERVAQAMYKAGEVSAQCVAAAKLESAHAALARLDALFKAQQAAATLESALQLPLELPVTLLSNPPVQANRP